VDSERADAVIEATLESITASKAQVFILDISGVTEMDAQVAGHLTKVAKASQLMGCECIISGVSPLVAQHLVDLGVHLGDVTTTATMRDAFAKALKLLRIRLR
jgi:rsbT co-antagonist protein RsbR